MSKKNKTPDGGAVTVKGGGIKKYFRDLGSDLKKITWPSRQELFNNLTVVLALIIAVMVYVTLSDTLLSFLYGLLLGNK